MAVNLWTVETLRESSTASGVYLTDHVVSDRPVVDVNLPLPQSTGVDEYTLAETRWSVVYHIARTSVPT